MIKCISIHSSDQGLHEITSQIESVVRESRTREGICKVFVQHTSASLLIQENADPSAKRDLESWLNRLVKEEDPLYSHTTEGSDDMPSHIKAALTAVIDPHLERPARAGNLARDLPLGTPASTQFPTDCDPYRQLGQQPHNPDHARSLVISWLSGAGERRDVVSQLHIDFTSPCLHSSRDDLTLSVRET